MKQIEVTILDQSYVLGVLTQDQLRHSHFPLGGSVKTDVRDEAARRALCRAMRVDDWATLSAQLAAL